MTADIARELLIRGAHALAHSDSADQALDGVLRASAEAFEAGSAAIVATDREPGLPARTSRRW